MNSGRAPVRIAHAYGDRREPLARALTAPVDMIEADIWYHAGGIWVRHEPRLGPLPLLLDRRMPGHPPGPFALPLWPRHYLRLDIDPLPLAELLAAARGKRRLLLDMKARDSSPDADAFAAVLAAQLREQGAEGQAAACGQNWRLLDRLRERAPWLEVRFSMQRPQQWEAFLRRAETDDGLRRVCIERRLMTAERARWLEERGVDVYCWTVDDRAEAQRLVAAGVDGIISNDLALLAALGTARTDPATL